MRLERQVVSKSLDRCDHYFLASSEFCWAAIAGYGDSGIRLTNGACAGLRLPETLRMLEDGALSGKPFCYLSFRRISRHPSPGRGTKLQGYGSVERGWAPPAPGICFLRLLLSCPQTGSLGRLKEVLSAGFQRSSTGTPCLSAASRIILMSRARRSISSPKSAPSSS